MSFLRRFFVLAALLALGLGAEAAWHIRERVGLRSWTGFSVFGRFEGPSHSFEDVRELPAATTVEIDNSFGSVVVRGTDAAGVTVRLRKQVYAADAQEAARAAAEVRLVDERVGDVVRLSTRAAGDATRRIGVATHFSVEVPRSARVRVRNEHGSAEALAVAAADVETTHDDGRLEDVAGEARLSVRHGDAVARRVGALSLACRFGTATIEDAGATGAEVEHGRLTVARAASLEAEVAQGDTSAEGIAGAVRVQARHGDVDLRDVGAATVEVEIGSVTVVGAQTVDARARHGSVRLERVAGHAFASATHQGVELTDVGGGAEVEVEHGGLIATGVRGGLTARVSGDDVTLEAVSGALDVESRRGRLTLTAVPPLGPTVLQSQHGDVLVWVPAGTGAAVEAAASRGRVEVDLPDFTVSEQTGERVAGRLGAGGASLRVTAEHGDVAIRLRPATDLEAR